MNPPSQKPPPPNEMTLYTGVYGELPFWVLVSSAPLAAPHFLNICVRPWCIVSLFVFFLFFVFCFLFFVFVFVFFFWFCFVFNIHLFSDRLIVVSHCVPLFLLAISDVYVFILGFPRTYPSFCHWYVTGYRYRLWVVCCVCVCVFFFFKLIW